MLKRIALKPGINREGTAYTAEGTWYACDKVRFRGGLPQKIGGWRAVSQSVFTGVCRALLAWGTLGGLSLVGIGTSKKYYIEYAGVLYDATPVRSTGTIGSDPFTSYGGGQIVTVAHTAHGAKTGDYVTFSGATTFNGIPAASLNQNFSVTVINNNSYNILVDTAANASGTGGGAAVVATYEVPAGADTAQTIVGWGSGGWGTMNWGQDPVGAVVPFRVWSHQNYGENLLYGPVGGPLYYLNVSTGLTALDDRGVALSTLPNASNVPLFQNRTVVSDASRFVLVFGTNEIGGTTLDPMLIRWSDQENLVNWTPAITNQAGGIRLSNGTKIVAAQQAKQEILVLTDTALYSLQFVGAPFVWGTSLVGENISVASSRAMASTNNATYWMGRDKFYIYNGRVDTLPCALKQYVFDDINATELDQVFAGTNEGFNEVWWFYCSADSAFVNRYVVYNYAENVWYYGSMYRTAWLDSGLRPNPLAVGYENLLLAHEVGEDDGTFTTPQPIYAYIQSGDFDIEDGQTMGFVTRILPDITFTGSSTAAPAARMVIYPRNFSGSPYVSEPPQDVVLGAAYPVEQYTEQVFVRARGRMLSLRVDSDTLGTAWQLGHPRIDVRPDGRKA